MNAARVHIGHAVGDLLRAGFAQQLLDDPLRLGVVAQSALVPVRGEHVVAVEELAELRIVEAFPLPATFGHDVQNCLKRRDCRLYRPILDVVPGGPFLGLGNVEDAIGEVLEALQFGPEHLFGEDGRWRVEYASEELGSEQRSDTVSKPARRYDPAVMLEVLHLFQVSMLDQEGRIALLRRQPRPPLIIADGKREQAIILFLGHGETSFNVMHRIGG